MRIGILELVVILVLVLVLFGSSQIPKLARSLKEAKEVLSNDSDDCCIEETNEEE